MIRQATSADVDEILRLYKAGVEELGYDYKESLLVNKIVTSYHLAPCFLYEDNGIKGFAGFTVNTYPHNGEPVMCEYMFYVEPEHRNIEVLGQIVKAAQDFANQNKFNLRVEFIVLGDLELKKRVLERNGFEVTGIIGVHR
jgi:GNAT superfamily N-acetyltransferase